LFCPDAIMGQMMLARQQRHPLQVRRSARDRSVDESSSKRTARSSWRKASTSTEQQ